MHIANTCFPKLVNYSLSFCESVSEPLLHSGIPTGLPAN